MAFDFDEAYSKEDKKLEGIIKKKSAGPAVPKDFDSNYDKLHDALWQHEFDYEQKRCQAAGEAFDEDKFKERFKKLFNGVYQVEMGDRKKAVPYLNEVLAADKNHPVAKLYLKKAKKP